MAKSVTATYQATSAIGSGSDHSVWFKSGFNIGDDRERRSKRHRGGKKHHRGGKKSRGYDLGRDFDFVPAGVFTLFSDGTATLVGRIVSQKSSKAWFDLAFNYGTDFIQTPQFKSENGSVETPDTFFRDLEGGTLIGGGILEGLDLSVSRMPADGKYATQIGPGTATNNGANNKNRNFGMANWFTVNVDSAECKICTFSRGKKHDGERDWVKRLRGSQGDVNVDLTPVPLPAAGLLLVGALGSLGALRRRKRKAA